MAGANWTRKDYQAVAELVGSQLMEITDRGNDNSTAATVIAQRLLHLALVQCRLNAAYDNNGNRNFNESRFIDECYKQAGMVRP